MLSTVVLAGCASDPAATTTPPPPAAMEERKKVIAAIDSGDAAHIVALFPSQNADEVESIFRTCSTISEASRRMDEDHGESPRTLYVTLTGASRDDPGRQATCSFLLYWTDAREWRLSP
ncbi:hypothetical protein [Rathayibacter tanaceti]|uniref:hypothetical protein n=1 Tax=Rathayibacter tanaceti TaxID=1671680 RepID=UPI001AD828F6|nr:hypothetical protein [Rathayibacter tanaceti]